MTNRPRAQNPLRYAAPITRQGTARCGRDEVSGPAAVAHLPALATGHLCGRSCRRKSQFATKLTKLSGRLAGQGRNDAQLASRSQPTSLLFWQYEPSSSFLPHWRLCCPLTLFLPFLFQDASYPLTHTPTLASFLAAATLPWKQLRRDLSPLFEFLGLIDPSRHLSATRPKAAALGLVSILSPQLVLDLDYILEDTAPRKPTRALSDASFCALLTAYFFPPFSYFQHGYHQRPLCCCRRQADG